MVPVKSALCLGTPCAHVLSFLRKGEAIAQNLFLAVVCTADQACPEPLAHCLLMPMKSHLIVAKRRAVPDRAQPHERRPCERAPGQCSPAGAGRPWVRRFRELCPKNLAIADRSKFCCVLRVRIYIRSPSNARSVSFPSRFLCPGVRRRAVLVPPIRVWLLPSR